jgi:hypothetical protein
MSEKEEQETHLQGHHDKDGRECSPVSEHEDPSLLLRSEVRRGPLPGDVRGRIVRPRALSFRRVRTGLLEATEETEPPRNTLERVIYPLKRLLIGAPLTSTQEEQERSTKFKVLAVLSSDAISSVAYATEAILVTLIAAGSSSLGLTLPISVAIVGLLCIVTLSYRQTIPAYPKGGGSYIVAKENLGTLPGLIAAALLLIVFKGDITHLISLYAVGVFLSFTLSQSGIVLHWWQIRGEQKGWRGSLLLNSVGAGTTLLVVVVVASTKFMEGAWMVIVLIPVLVLLFLSIRRHYQWVERERTIHVPIHSKDIRHRLIVPIAGLDRGAIQSLAYARSISRHVTAVHVALDLEDAQAVQDAWQEWQKQLSQEEETQLVIIESPYRSLSRPLLAYIDTLRELYPEDTLTVILPEFVVAHWWEHLLHNQAALRLKAALLFHPGIVVTTIPQHLSSGGRR